MLFAFSYFFFMHFTWLDFYLVLCLYFPFLLYHHSSLYLPFLAFSDTEFSNQQIILDMLYITAIPWSLYHLSCLVCICMIIRCCKPGMHMHFCSSMREHADKWNLFYLFASLYLCLCLFLHIPLLCTSCFLLWSKSSAVPGFIKIPYWPN